MENKKIYGVMLVGCGHIGKQHIEDIYYRDNINSTPEVVCIFKNKHSIW